MAADDLVTIDQLREAKSDVAFLSEVVNGPNGRFASRFGESIPSLQRVMDTILAEGLGGVTQNREVVNTFAALQALERDPETREVLMLGYSQPSDGGGERWYLDTVDATPDDLYPLRAVSANGDVWRPFDNGNRRNTVPTSKLGDDIAMTLQYADGTNVDVVLSDEANFAFPMVIDHNVTIDLNGREILLSDVRSTPIGRMFEIAEGKKVTFKNGMIDGSNLVSTAMFDLNDRSELCFEDFEIRNTGSSDDPLNNVAGIRSLRKVDTKLQMKRFKFQNVSFGINMVGSFSAMLEDGEFVGYSRACHEFVSDGANTPNFVFCMNLLAHGVKPNATKYAFRFNRSSGRRIDCNPIYINCDVIGNVNPDGTPVTFIGGANPNNGHADMWAWQGVDGGLRINCSCRNGGDSGESLTRTTSRITNINCSAINMEGHGVNSGSALAEVTITNPSNRDNFERFDNVGVGALCQAEIASIDGNVITFINQIPANTLAQNTVEELGAVRGFVTPELNRASAQAFITAKTNTTVTVNNVGGFRVGNKVYLGADASIAFIDTILDYDDRSLLLGNIVYQRPRTTQIIRKDNHVMIIREIVTGEGNTWIGGHYANNAQNNDGSSQSFANFFFSMHDSGQLQNVTLGEAPIAVIVNFSDNIRINSDTSRADDPVQLSGGGSYIDMYQTVSNDASGRFPQVKSSVLLTRLGAASFPEIVTMNPGAMFYSVEESRNVMRGNSAVLLDLCGNEKQGDYWPWDGPVSFPIVATANRPAANTLPTGFTMIDTTLNKMIWVSGAVWRDAMGTIV